MLVYVDSFNPTLVRLAQVLYNQPLQRSQRFNPTLVRLAHIAKREVGGKQKSVSIPRWFD